MHVHDPENDERRLMHIAKIIEFLHQLIEKQDTHRCNGANDQVHRSHN